MARNPEIIPKILEILQAGAETTATLCDVFTSGYTSSYRKARSGKAVRFHNDWAEEYRVQQRFYSLMNHLKHEGLVEKKRRGRSSVWNITKRGFQNLWLWQRRDYRREQQREASERDSHETLKIVMFDVPEQERNKRAWLVAVLRAMGFTMRQKSVWVGKKKIPEEFIRELKKKRMSAYVDVVGVTRSGTLRELLK